MDRRDMALVVVLGCGPILQEQIKAERRLRLKFKAVSA
jgi:hypothetical protein